VGLDAPLVGIVDLSKLEVQAQAAVSDVAQIAPGARAMVAIEGISDRQFEGRVERINPSAETGTRSINFYVSLPNDKTVLRAGMFAKVFLHVGGERPVPALPIAATRNDGAADFVWTLAEGKLRKQPVTLGRRDERAQMVEIRSGLTPADRVIATKFDNLRDGMPAKVIGGTPADAVAETESSNKPAAIKPAAAIN
jgi:RND family efflux transporter MFP subunit